MKEAKILRINNNCLIVFNGKKIHTNKMTDEIYKRMLFYKEDWINNMITDDEFEDRITMLMSDELNDTEKYLSKHVDRANSVITKRGNSYYLWDISELTLPLDFVEKIYKAEDDGNDELIQTYKNFWTLVSLNPDSRVRNDIFWFIQRWGIKIAKSGLLIMYRNVDIADNKDVKYDTYEIEQITQKYDHVRHVSKKNPSNYFVYRYLDDKCELFITQDSEYDVVHDDYELLGSLRECYDEIINSSKQCDFGKTTPVYTDHYSHKFKIKIGEIVSMPREECNPDQSCSCSKGLNMQPSMIEILYENIEQNR